MEKIELLQAASRTTTAILNLIRAPLGHPAAEQITMGLPAGSLLLRTPKLAIGGTPCTVPLFRGTMRNVATKLNVDVLVARHGNYPELLDCTLFDVATPSGGDVVCIHDLVLYVDRFDEHWLVPSGAGAFIRIGFDGLHIESEPPFVAWSERCDGVCAGASCWKVATSTPCSRCRRAPFRERA
jgi:hypothetical protein